ncbi:MAG: amidohydrolase family protein [Victivallaceae bacterium]|nr:amidohydrolase family protein [Victivallaceae bacterium]
MCRLLDDALADGAIGLSAGLLYVPGKFADAGEITALMRVVAARDRIYTTHLRSEGDRLLESLEETFDAARAANLKRIQISHFKTAGRANWGKIDAALELIENARAEGISVTVDRYPYLESMTQLSVILPGKWGDLDDITIQSKLRSGEECRALADALRAARAPEYWKSVRLVSTTGVHSADGGKILAELSDDPATLVVELLAHDCAGTTAAFAGMCRENMERIVALDYCMPGSDANAFPADESLGRAHWRAFGAITRFIRMRLDATGNIAAAVRRATGLPAETFQLADAGSIAAGKSADLVAFDPDEIDGASGPAFPHRPAKGIFFTLKRGEFVYRA